MPVCVLYMAVHGIRVHCTGDGYRYCRGGNTRQRNSCIFITVKNAANADAVPSLRHAADSTQYTHAINNIDRDMQIRRIVTYIELTTTHQLCALTAIQSPAAGSACARSLQSIEGRNYSGTRRA